jgi:hypothetical protein
VEIHQRDQPHVGKVLRRHCGHHVFGPGIPPRAPPVDARLPRSMRVQAKRSQARFPCNHSPCRAGRGLSPPSRCALPGAPIKETPVLRPGLKPSSAVTADACSGRNSRGPKPTQNIAGCRARGCRTAGKKGPGAEAGTQPPHALASGACQGGRTAGRPSLSLDPRSSRRTAPRRADPTASPRSARRLVGKHPKSDGSGQDKP